MKRLLALFMVLLTLCACFTACGDEPTEYNGFQMISNTDIVEYYFYVPLSWSVDRSDGMTMAHVSSNDLTSLSISAYDPQNAKSLQAYMERYQSEQIPALGTATYTVQNQNRLLGKDQLEALQSEFTLTIGETTYHYMQIACSQNGYVYLITYTAPDAEKYAAHMEDVEKSLNAFEFRK